MQKIAITTEDNIELSALFWDRQALVSVLLLHMMPATKESWIPLAGKLANLGMNVLAIDLRGHGESDGGSYEDFTPEQHYGYFKDQVAAVKFLKDFFPHYEMYMGGASIGANMTIKFMAQHGEVKKGFALSAGLDYYGVRAIDDVPKLRAEQKILLVGSRDDTRKSGSDCGAMAEQLYDAAGGQKDKIIYENGGHGTDMWTAHPELIETIIKFLE